MKKIQYILFILAIALPFGVSAATFSIVPNVGTIKPGNTIISTVYVNPGAGETIAAAKVSILFPVSKIEAISYTPVSGGSILAHIGTKTDNTAGIIVDNVAFNPAITVPTKIATITFKAKADGNAKITFSSDSKLLDTTTVDKYVVSSGASFTIATPAPAPKPKPKVKKTPVVKTAPTTTQTATEDTSETATTTTEVATTTATTTLQGQTAAVSETGTGFFTTKNISIAIALILLIILGFFFWKRKSE